MPAKNKKSRKRTWKVNLELTLFFTLVVMIAGIFFLTHTSISITGAVVGTQDFGLAALPVIDSLVLNTTNITLNDTTVNLTAYVNVSDMDGDSVKIIFNWLRNNTPIAVLNMPFEKINGTDTNNAWDYSSRQYNGSVNSATWNLSGGHDGKGAYNFDGINDYVNITTAGFTPTQNFTLTIWTKKELDQAQTGFKAVAATEPYETTDNFGIWSNGNNWYFQVFGNGVDVSATSSAINYGSWTHLALVYEAGVATKVRFFVNGTLVSSSTNSPDIVTSRGLKIGDYSGGTGFYNGTIDEIMLFNKSLSAEQIFALYQNKTNIIVSNETMRRENWTVQATPNDGTEDGLLVTSNNVTILNALPIISSLVLNSTNISSNNTNTNLTAYTTTSDADNDSVKLIYNWLRNATSIAVLNMPFEGINDTTTYNAWDYSGYGRNGSDNGGILWNAAGGYDGKGAYLFDGVNDYISGNNVDNVGTNGSTTISVWVFPQSVTGERTIFNKGSFGTCYNYGLALSGANLEARNSDRDTVLASEVMVLNAWKHLAIVYNGSGAFGYVDGTFQGSSAAAGTTDCSSLTWTLGVVSTNRLTENFRGYIDDLIIFNRSLSPEQIFALWQNKTHTITAQETVSGENWTVQATPNDGYEDGAMNTSNNVTILDKIVPSVNITYPANGSNFSAVEKYFNATVTDTESSISIVIFVFNNRTNPFNITASNSSGTWNVTINTTRLAEGLQGVAVYANDSSNNINYTQFINFTVDYTAPTVNITGPSAGATLSGTLSFNATINDSLLQISTVIFQFSNTTPFNRTASNSSGTWNVSVDTTAIAEGALTVTVFANDTVGNINSTQNLAVTIDNVAETTSGVGTGSGGGGGGSSKTTIVKPILPENDNTEKTKELPTNIDPEQDKSNFVDEGEGGDKISGISPVSEKEKEALVGFGAFLRGDYEEGFEQLKKNFNKIAVATFSSLINYTIYWFLTIALVIIVLVGLHVKDLSVPEFLLKMRPAPEVKVEKPMHLASVQQKVTMPELSKWGKKNYLDLQQELKRVDVLLKHTPIPEQKNKISKLTLIKPVQVQQKAQKIGSDQAAQRSILSRPEVEQWIMDLLGSGTPARKAISIVQKATPLTETEIKKMLLKAGAAQLLKKTYSLNDQGLAELQEFISYEQQHGATIKQIAKDLIEEGWDKNIIKLYVAAYYTPVKYNLIILHN